MDYARPELQDKLAAEYVLGTLHGLARKRFERLALGDPAIRKRIRYWEHQLTELHDNIEPVIPAPKVWKKIVARIAPGESKKPSLFAQAGIWQAFSLAMLMFIVVGLSNIEKLIKPVESPIAQYVTVLATESSQAAWIVRLYPGKRKVTVQALKSTEPGLQKAFELWMLPGGGASPKSVGLLPVSGEKTLELDSQLLAVLLDTNTLAVSLEPAGGSPTGLPTGPVVYTGKLNSI